MKAATLLKFLGLAALGSANAGSIRPRDYEANDYYILHIDRDTSPSQIASRLGLDYQGVLGELTDHHIFSCIKNPHDVVKRELQERRRKKRALNDFDLLDGVLLSKKQVLRKPWEKRIPPVYQGPAPRAQGIRDEAAVKRLNEISTILGIKDPIFAEQWHLFNSVQVGHDVNVTGAWMDGVTGKNTTVAIVDDGLDMYSDDLKDNYYAEGSYDFNDKSDEPKPRLSDDRHGTRCAGEVAAVRNDVCGVGVAYDAKVAGLRILSKQITDADEAVALQYDFQHNLIYSCSWGPPDDGRSMDAPSVVIKRAMLNSIQKGRNGLGSIYVFASGNGAAQDDNCNFDGYTNSIFSITVGAIDHKGQHPYYSELCSASLVVTYSSGDGEAIHTTDVGQNQCFNGHGGTSAAAPIVAGIFALALQVNPALTWRDMQYIAMDTAIPLNLDSGDWQDTTIGKKYSHTYAYGKVDTYALVQLARTWKNVKPQAWFFSPWMHVKKAIPEGEQGLASSYQVTEDMLKEANLERIEHVTVTMNVNHTRRGDLSVDLISPDGLKSHLSVIRRQDDAEAGYVDWTFMSVVHWGEKGIGKWTVIVKDTVVNDHNGTFVDWHLKLWGECIDPKKAKELPMPTDEDDDDHDNIATTTAVASTTTLAPGSATSSLNAPPDNPSDHPDRPTKQPGDTEAPAPEKSNSSWLPSFVSNLSTKTQAWIYGALALIVVFCSGLGIYLYMARRKRRANARDNYEFELIDEEEAEGLNSGEKSFSGKKGRKTRGGELYDAFAGGSDEEEDFDAEYHDREGSGSGSASASASGSGSGSGSWKGKRAATRDDGSDDGDEEHHVIGDDTDDEPSGVLDEEERNHGHSLLGRQ